MPAKLVELFEAFDVDLSRPESGPKATSSLLSRRAPLQSAGRQLGRLGELVLTSDADFDAEIAATGWDPLTPSELEIFQINVGKLCNMTCRHCHVDAGPDRTDEMMDERDWSTLCIDAHRTARSAHTVDHHRRGAGAAILDFRYLVDACVERGKHVIDRCNLTILLVQQATGICADVARRAAASRSYASLPHFRPKLNTDAQRGDGTFEKSIEALRAAQRGRLRQRATPEANTHTDVQSRPARFSEGNQATLDGKASGSGSPRARLRRDLRPPLIVLEQHADLSIPRVARRDGEQSTGVHARSSSIQLQPRSTISGLMCLQHDLRSRGDGQDLRLRLQPDARHRRPRLPKRLRAHVRDFDNGPLSAKRRISNRPPLLRLHRGGRELLWRGHRLTRRGRRAGLPGSEGGPHQPRCAVMKVFRGSDRRPSHLDCSAGQSVSRQRLVVAFFRFS